MKTRHFAVILIVAMLAFIAVLIFLLFSRRSIRLSDDQTSMTQAIATSNSTLIIRKLTSSKTNATQAQPPFNTALKTSDASAPSQFNERIEFYGKVIDENSNAIPGAHINFQWDAQVSPFHTKPQFSGTTTDAKGLFSLEGVKGTVLDVRVSSVGYYTPRPGVKGFNYGGQNGFSPDSRNPVIFKLRKKGPGTSVIETDIPPFAHVLQLHHDGTPIYVDLLKGAEVPSGSGQLKLQLWRDLSDENARKFDWKLQLSIEGGGFVPTSEEFAFDAPQIGYQPTLLFDMSATNRDWQGEIRNKYYIQLSNGDYGRIDFYFQSFNGAFTIHSVVNPSGSQNLEPAN